MCVPRGPLDGAITGQGKDKIMPAIREQRTEQEHNALGSRLLPLVYRQASSVSKDHTVCFV